MIAVDVVPAAESCVPGSDVYQTMHSRTGLPLAWDIVIKNDRDIAGSHLNYRQSQWCWTTGGYLFRIAIQFVQVCMQVSSPVFRNTGACRYTHRSAHSMTLPCSIRKSPLSISIANRWFNKYNWCPLTLDSYTVEYQICDSMWQLHQPKVMTSALHLQESHALLVQNKRLSSLLCVATDRCIQISSFEMLT